MDVGLALPQRGPLATLDALRHVAAAAEDGGFASLWAFERLPGVAGDPLDPVVAAATAAAVTDRIRIGVDALVASSYPAHLLRRVVRSLDQAGSCRLVFGFDRVDSTPAVDRPLPVSLRGSARDLGVDPARLRLVERGTVTLTPAALGADRPRFVGSLDQVRADVARLCNDGAHELVLDLHRAASSVGHLLDLAVDLTDTLRCPA